MILSHKFAGLPSLLHFQSRTSVRGNNKKMNARAALESASQCDFVNEACNPQKSTKSTMRSCIACNVALNECPTSHH
jgi:hypothetical protein